jgi:homoserine dehydrogenase
MRRRYDVRWRLTGVATRRTGWVADPDGLNPIALLNGRWPERRGAAPAPQNIAEWLEQSRVDVFFETSSLNPQNGQPATDHLRAALNHGSHAISANKGPVVHAYEELMTLARERSKKFLCEATVMDGVPIFSMFPSGLPATELHGFSGVLNSTSNVVLTEVEKGLSFDDAVRRAQALGIAETDPSNDLDGWDSAVKVVALAIILMGVPVKLEQVQRTGIRELSEEKIRSVRAVERAWIARYGPSSCWPAILWRIWKAPARPFISIWMCSGCRWSSTIPESTPPRMVYSPIFCVPCGRLGRPRLHSKIHGVRRSGQRRVATLIANRYIGDQP